MKFRWLIRVGASLSLSLALVLPAKANTVYVAPDGAGDGSSWGAAAGLATALGSAQAGDELWLKAGTYAPQDQLAATVALTIRGGFAGTEASADERTGTACAVIDGEMAYPTGTASGVVKGLFKVTAASGTLTLDRIEITRSYQQGLQVSGGANVVLKDSRFIDNGYYVNANHYAMPGRGAHLTGAAGTTVQVTNCCFEGNVLGSRTGSGSEMGNGASNGGGLYVKTFASVDLADCAFVTNGLPTLSGAKSGRDKCRGGALYAEDAPVTAMRVKFIGNGAISHGTLAGGSAVFLVGNCGGSSFTNCLFLANFCRMWQSGSTGSCGGAFCAELGANDQTLSFGNCTFAYNLDSPSTGAASLGAGAVMLIKGALDCRDSIFYGNLVRKGCTVGADLYCGANASAVLDNCFLTDSADPDYIRNNGGRVTITNVRSEDPLLATDKPAMLTMLNATGSIIWPVNGEDFRFKDGSNLTIFDAHLKSVEGRFTADGWVKDAVQSPAIDAADPETPYDLEPTPNGEWANSGAYGNTAEASKTPAGRPDLGEIVIDQTCDYTQPHYAFTLGGEGMFAAKVTLCCGLSQGHDDGTGWDKTIELAAAALIGDSFSGGFRRYFSTGDTVYWRIIAKTATATDAKAGSLTITGAEPPWKGKGGPANVIHVRANPGGDETGENWTDAVPDLSTALAMLSEAKTEIWIAGDLPPITKALTIPNAVTIRGGFNAYESAPEDRQPGAVSTIDGGKTMPLNVEGLVNLTATEGEYVLDALAFARSYHRGLMKTGAADLTLVGCRFTDNGYKSNVACTGRGLYATGSTSLSRLTVTDCVFEGNREHLPTAIGTSNISGGGAYVKDFAAVTIVGTAFVTNGFERSGMSNAPGRDNTHGGALYVENAPVQVKDSSFVGNSCVSHNANDYDGGCVYVCGNSSGARFENCAFIGNLSWPYNGYGRCGGALTFNLPDSADAASVVNCTFAYNLHAEGSSAAIGAAALNCRKGAIAVENSIFFGNLVRSGSSCVADVYVNAEATCTLDSCLVEQEGDAAIRHYSSSVQKIDVLVGDPLFATDRTTVLAMINHGSMSGPACGDSPYFKKIADTLAIDVHVASTVGRWDPLSQDWVTDQLDSPAIDTGRAASPYALEPEPNGNRVNLGRWGNTSEASKTAAGMPRITAVSAYMTNDYTRPYFDITIGGTGVFNARVTLYVKLDQPGGDEPSSWGEVKTVALAAENGAFLQTSSDVYYPPLRTVCWRVVAEAPYGSDVLEGTVRTSAELPPWNGRKGPANVIHVRGGAMGTGDGLSWDNAAPTLAAAVAQVTDERNEIWIAKDLAIHELQLDTPTKSFTLVGGFSELYETNVADLAAGVLTTVAGNGYDNCLVVAPAAGETVTVRRIRFTASQRQALKKTGAGSLTVENCVFESCGLYDKQGTAIPGRGIYAAGGNAAGSRLAVSNCVFRDNIMRAGYDGGRTADESGCGVYAYQLGGAEVVDSLFATNGVALGTVSPDGRDSTHGTALCLVDAPAAVRRCAFIGNGCPCHNAEAGDGGPVYVGGKSGGTVFENCLFLGNFTRRVDVPAFKRYGSGALMVSLKEATDTVFCDKCTFAYNFADGAGGTTAHYADTPATNETAGAVQVLKGALTVSNSIFWGNFTTTNAATTGAAGDILVGKNASVTVGYTLFAGLSEEYVATMPGGSVTLAEGCFAGDPCLVSKFADFAALLNPANCRQPLMTKGSNVYMVRNPKDLNGHLRGSRGYNDERTGLLTVRRGVSAAVDAGDPAADCSREPGPNGRRVNLGAYGNTPWATRSGPAPMMILVR